MDKRRKSEERRRLDRLERTGANNFVCIGCFGCTDHCTAERHHVGGRRYDPYCEYFCANFHRRLTEAQRSHPKQIDKEPGAIVSVAHYLFGLADVSALIPHTIEEYGHKLIDVANRLKSADRADQDLTREAGHYLIQIAAFQGRSGGRLKHHGDNLIAEAKKGTHNIPRTGP